MAFSICNCQLRRHKYPLSCQKPQLLQWINNSKMPDGSWGPSSTSLSGDVAHTVFALLIIHYCGIDIEIIKKTYRASIRWLKKRIRTSTVESGAFSYEAIEAYDPNLRDRFGERANILKSYHFNAALLCNLFLTLNNLGVSMRIIKRLIALRKDRGGWGLSSDNKIFVWATQQAIDCIYRFEGHVFRNKSTILGNIKCIAYSIPYFKIKLLCGLVFSLVFVLLSTYAGKMWDILLGLTIPAIPWLFKTDD